MFWTWDSYRTEDAVWRRDRNNARHDKHPLSHFLATVDVLFYAAAVAFVICVIVVATA